VSERLIKKALYPYPRELVIATQGRAEQVLDHWRARGAGRLHATSSQVALAWLLRRSDVMLLIPGTSRVRHLDENVAAALLELSIRTSRNSSAADVCCAPRRRDRSSVSARCCALATAQARRTTRRRSAAPERHARPVSSHHGSVRFLPSPD